MARKYLDTEELVTVLCFLGDKTLLGKVYEESVHQIPTRFLKNIVLMLKF